MTIENLEADRHTVRTMRREDLGAAEAEAAGNGRYHRGTFGAMILTAALADIVKQNRQQQLFTLFNIFADRSDHLIE